MIKIDKKFYSIKELCDIFGVSYTCMYNYLKNNYKTIKLGKRILVPYETLILILKEQGIPYKLEVRDNG